MKTKLTAIAAGLVVFGAVYAFAASLSVDGGMLQAGGDNDLTCDTTGVTVTYTLVWNATTSDYDVDQVTVNGIEAACASLTLEVDLANASGTTLSHASATVQAAGGNQLVNVPNTNAAAVVDAEVAIHS